MALHEIGHLSGLAHSALGETELQSDGGRRVIAAEAVMFPIAYPPGNISARSLRADDIAGMSDLYPDGGFADSTGSISGRVSLNGSGIFGAHIAAFDPANGTIVAGFSLDGDGRFSIAGLSPGPHALGAEPLDDADMPGSSMTTAGLARFSSRLLESPVVVRAPATAAQSDRRRQGVSEGGWSVKEVIARDAARYLILGACLVLAGT